MRLCVLLPAFLLMLLSALPTAAQAAGIPFFDPIVPDAINRCAAGWPALIQVINNIISFSITIAIVFVAPLMIAYSGFLFVVNPVSPGGIEKAKGILLNTISGIVIALAGWLIVSAVMAVLYNPGATSGTTTLGAWQNIITGNGNDLCLIQEGALNNLNQTNVGVTGINSSGSVLYGNNGATAQCSSSNTACSPSALQAAGFTPTQANVMSCIAVTESSGIPGTPPYNTTHPGSNSTACGTFQITQTNWKQYAAGACSSFSSCMDATCNIQVAQVLVSRNGYKDWTCAGCNNKAASCVQQYGG